MGTWNPPCALGLVSRDPRVSQGGVTASPGSPGGTAGSRCGPGWAHGVPRCPGVAGSMCGSGRALRAPGVPSTSRLPWAPQGRATLGIGVWRSRRVPGRAFWGLIHRPWAVPAARRVARGLWCPGKVSRGCPRKVAAGLGAGRAWGRSRKEGHAGRGGTSRVRREGVWDRAPPSPCMGTVLGTAPEHPSPLERGPGDTVGRGMSPCIPVSPGKPWHSCTSWFVP